MKILGKDLVFISQINRDGSGVHKVADDYIAMMLDETFRVRCLSLTENTYIATNFNSFVVRLRETRTESELSPMDKAADKFRNEYKYFFGDDNVRQRNIISIFEEGWKAAQLHFTNQSKQL